MEFHEKLQELRKQKGLTQEQLASALYVSRTAVSKWESGRGYPNLDSLQAIARYFDLPVDDLLSHGALPSAEKTAPMRELLFGLLDVSVLALLFVPLFGEKEMDGVTAVSLLSLTGAAPYMRVLYLTLVAVTVAVGLLTLALQSCGGFWQRNKRRLSLAVSGAGTLLFIMGGQPYAAAVMLFFLAVKGIFLLKKP